MNENRKVLAICIKEYQDEDSVEEFERGNIDYEDIKTYTVGYEDYVYPLDCDKDYWKLKL
jgi:hypothetical protein